MSKEPTSIEKFEAFDKDHFGKKDTPINYETLDCPIIGTLYVDAFTQTRYSYWNACESEQSKVIAELVEALEQSITKRSVDYVNESEESDFISACIKLIAKHKG